MAGDVDVEQNQDEERNEEEDDDDEDEVALAWVRVHRGQADGADVVRRVLDHGQDGRRQREGQQPRDQARHACL